MHPHIELHTQKCLFLRGVAVLLWQAENHDLKIIEVDVYQNELNHDPKGLPTTKEEFENRIFDE